MHVTLYRKYRPKDFEEIAGQEEIVKTLKASLRSGKLSHAYLFAGPRGLGKTTIARLIAKGVNCLANGVTDEPCNKCANCLAINDGTFVDMIEIDAASNRGIGEIREIKDKINYQPSNGRKKIYIIDEVHMLTKEAFNALLKTLEEPPEHVIFILATTEPDKVLPTIISRCQRYDFKPVTLEDMTARLKYISEQEKIDIDEGVYQLIYENASGGMRDSISILERLMLTCYEEKITVDKCEKVLGITSSKKMKEFLDKILGGDMREVVRSLDEYWKDSVEPELFFKDLAKYCKDQMEKAQLEIDRGLEIIGAIYDGLSKFKYEEDKRLVGYVIIDDIMNKKKQVEERIIEREVEKVVTTVAPNDKEEIEDINVKIEEINSKWADILKDAKKEKISLGVFLRNAKPFKLEKNILYISFDKKDVFSKEQMEKQDYNKAFTEIVHKRIHPKMILRYLTIGDKPLETKKKEDLGEKLEDYFNGNII